MRRSSRPGKVVRGQARPVAADGTVLPGESHVRRVQRVARHPLVAIPLATFSVLLLVCVLGLLIFNRGSTQLPQTDSSIVIINSDDKEQTVPTRAATVRELLDRQGITLNEGDVVEPGLDTEIAGDNFRVNVYRGKPVTIVDNDKKTFTFSAAATPRSIVKQAGIEVYPEDELLLLPTDNFLTEGSIGQRVVISRSVPIILNMYGTPVEMRTRAKTVGELLTERNIQLDPTDVVQPGLDTPIQPGMQIFLLREGQRIETVEEIIAMPEEVQQDASLSFGTTVVRQQGSAGKKAITYQIDDKTGERKVIQETIITQPVKQIVARGNLVNIPADKVRVMADAGISPAEYPYVDYIFSRESRWNAAARSASNCIGLGQNCPDRRDGSHWLVAACPNWALDPVCQTKRFTAYAQGRFGGWEGAYNYWLNNHHW